jgi:saccharopine dehydrogenase (NAD+, L-lysine-forming)
MCGLADRDQPGHRLELLANGTWSGAGVLGPEAFDAVPFLGLLGGEYGSPWGLAELSQGR